MKKVKFIVEGGRKLSGKVRVSGSKNAALPILCAALLHKGESQISNVPNIRDTRTLLGIFDFLDIKNEFKEGVVKIDTSNMKNKTLPHDLVCEFRAAILLLAPLLARFGKVKSAYPGGCVLGKRSVSAHLELFKKIGISVKADEEYISLEGKIKSQKLVLPEISVTATENALVALASSSDSGEILLAAAEPHVQDLCLALENMGAEIKGKGSHALKIQGKKDLDSLNFRVTSDYLEAGTLILAGIITASEIEVEDVVSSHLDSFFQKLSETGASFQVKKNSVFTYPQSSFRPLEKLRTAVFPSFPTDLQAPFGILLTKTNGSSRVFETLFENRFSYLYELEKMGANFEIRNAHEALIHGPSKLRGANISSCDIRAGAAMILAALTAEGKTEISNINYIDRGYENLDKKLSSLGAKIERV